MARHERALRLAAGELEGESNGAEGGTRTPTVLLPPARIPVWFRPTSRPPGLGCRGVLRLGRNDVLGARAFRALADGERHALALAQGVEWRTRARGLVKEIFGAVRRGDEAEAFVRDALDRAVGRHL